MPEVDVTQPATAESVAPPSETLIEGQQPGSTDTPETVAETDEQKNQRVAAEESERAKKRLGGFQRRINEITAEKHAAERRAEQMLAIVQQAISRGQQPQGSQPNPNGEPIRTADEAYEDWVARRAEWRAEQKLNTRLAEFTNAQQRQAQEAAQAWQRAQAAQSYSETVAEFSKANKADWDKYVANADDVQVPDGLQNILSDLGKDAPIVLLAIGRNPALAQSLNGLSERQLLVKTAQIAAAARSVPPQVSKAPPPGDPVGARTGSAGKDARDMSRDEYYASLFKKGGNK